MITKYTCSKCEREFSSFSECFNHEKECFTLEEVRQNILQSVMEIREEFKDKIKEVVEYDTPSIQTKHYTDNSVTYIDFKLHLVLHNGLDVYISADDIRGIVNIDEIKSHMKTAIDSKLITSYTGQLTFESVDWMPLAKLNGIDVMDILKLFEGKKIEIRVVED